MLLHLLELRHVFGKRPGQSLRFATGVADCHPIAIFNESDGFGGCIFRRMASYIIFSYLFFGYEELADFLDNFFRVHFVVNWNIGDIFRYFRAMTGTPGYKQSHIRLFRVAVHSPRVQQ